MSPIFALIRRFGARFIRRVLWETQAPGRNLNKRSLGKREERLSVQTERQGFPMTQNIVFRITPLGDPCPSVFATDNHFPRQLPVKVIEKRDGFRSTKTRAPDKANCCCDR